MQQAEGVCPSSPKVCSGCGLGFDTAGLNLSNSGSIYEPRNERETLKSPGTSLNFHSVTCGRNDIHHKCYISEKSNLVGLSV